MKEYRVWDMKFLQVKDGRLAFVVEPPPGQERAALEYITAGLLDLALSWAQEYEDLSSASSVEDSTWQQEDSSDFFSGEWKRWEQDDEKDTDPED